MSNSLQGKTILVVDDDPDILTAITATLADTQATIETATDGNSAVSIAESKSPDLVILDIMLPQKSGFLVLERLRQGRAKGEKPHIIMITGNQGADTSNTPKPLGVDAYLNKPFPMERLLEAAEKLLS